MKKVGILASQLSPFHIEAALEHCTTKEQCTGCPLLNMSRKQFCGQVLNVAVLQYVRFLKSQNETLERRVSELGGSTGQ